MNNHYRYGFTIVELLIVIVVVGILATISVASYGGIQERAQDTAVLASADQLVTAFKTSSLEPDFIVFNGGYSSSYNASTNTCTGGYGGWADYRNYSYNPSFCTIGTVLEKDGTLPDNFFASLPKTNKVQTNYSNGSKTMMWMECGSGTRKYAILYSLNTPRPDEMTQLNNECNGGSTWDPFVTYGMNAGRILSI